MGLETVLLSAGVGAIAASAVGGVISWLAQRNLATSQERWVLRRDAYRLYLNAVASIGHLEDGNEKVIREARANLVRAKSEIAVTAPGPVVTALEKLERIVTRSPGAWTDTSDGRTAFASLIRAMRTDLGGNSEISERSVGVILLGH